MENKYVVYGHYDDSGICFYIGIGDLKRPFKLKERSVLWQRYVGKHCATGKPEIKVWAKELTWEKACAMEKQWIALYGRKDKDTGCLVNLTDGGEGAINPSKETRTKISNTHKGKVMSLETRTKLAIAGIGKTHNRGKIRSEEAKQKIALINKGKPASLKTRMKIGKGYSYRKSHGKWVARITVLSKRKHLGYFDTEEEAAAAYNNALAEMFPA